MFPTPSSQRGELPKHMYAFFKKFSREFVWISSQFFFLYIHSWLSIIVGKTREPFHKFKVTLPNLNGYNYRLSNDLLDRMLEHTRMKLILLKITLRARSLAVIIIQDLVLSKPSMILPIFLLLRLELVVRDGTLMVFVGYVTVVCRQVNGSLPYLLVVDFATFLVRFSFYAY